LYHLVFSTKNRFPFIKESRQNQIYDYIGGTIRGLDGNLVEIGGIEDHAHLCVGLKPTASISKFVQDLKPAVTNWARDLITPKFEWQDGYGAFTVSNSQLPNVVNYLRNQREHHQKMAFDDEFVRLLDLNGVEFDPQYPWK